MLRKLESIKSHAWIRPKIRKFDWFQTALYTCLIVNVTQMIKTPTCCSHISINFIFLWKRLHPDTFISFTSIFFFIFWLLDDLFEPHIQQFFVFISSPKVVFILIELLDIWLVLVYTWRIRVRNYHINIFISKKNRCHSTSVLTCSIGLFLIIQTPHIFVWY